MPMDPMASLVLTGIVAVFVIFAVVLAWVSEKG
jgi:hypothetical protein